MYLCIWQPFTKENKHKENIHVKSCLYHRSLENSKFKQNYSVTIVVKQMQSIKTSILLLKGVQNGRPTLKITLITSY